jgi:hypothetical protein
LLCTIDGYQQTNPDVLFRDMMRSVMESGTAKSPLHLKIIAYHDDRLCEGATSPLDLLDLKQVLMPRQWFLKKLDPKRELSFPDLRVLLRQHMLGCTRPSSYSTMSSRG